MLLTRGILEGARSLAMASLLLAAVGGCSSKGKRMAPGPPAALYIRNNSFYDVNVYAVISSVQSRTRLAMVTGNTAMRVDVSERDLKPGRLLALYVHAIGSRSYWLSPELTMHPESMACLDIFTDPSGNASRSSLYTVPMVVVDADTSAALEQAARRRPPTATPLAQCGG